MPALPALLARDGSWAAYGTLDLRQGLALDLWLLLETLEPGQALVDTRDQNGAGLALVTTAAGAVEIVLNDGRCEQRWRSDSGVLRAGELQHVVASVDGGPKIITFVVDGVLCDGGAERQFGWGRFSPHLRTPQGRSTASLSPAVQGLRVYGRYLRTSEAISNYRAGLEG